MESGKAAEDRLGSWKEIAAYLRTAERTVQRWEVEEGLPVHRLTHRKRSTVFAYKSEIEAWLERRSSRAEVVPSEPSASAGGFSATPRLRRVLGLAAVVGLVGFLVWRQGEDLPAVVAPPPATPLTQMPGQEITPALSPDGSQAAFAYRAADGENFDIWVMEVPGGEPQRLTSNRGDELSPAWSPDGRKLAFVQANAGRGLTGGSNFSIVLATSEGDEERVIFQGRQPRSMFPWFGPWFAWHPDGESVIVPGGVGGEPGGLFRVSLDGSQMVRLTSHLNQAGGDMAPAVSPDGSMLAFVRRHNSLGGEVFVKPIDSDEPATRVSHWRGWASSPRFSPDGREIWVSAADVSAGRRLWSLAADGAREPRLLSVSGERAHELVVAESPVDGARMIYSQGIFRTDIWVADLETLEQRPFIASQFQDSSPTVSTDGKIAFLSDRSGRMELWVAGADGGHPEQLTRGLGTVITPPDWSPDGKQLAIAALGESGGDLLRIDASTGAVIKVETGLDHHMAPSWSRDGRAIFFRAPFRSRVRRIYRVPVEGGQAEPASPPRIQFLRSSLDGERTFVGRVNLQLQQIHPDGKTRDIVRLQDVSSFVASELGVHYLARSERREAAILGFEDFRTQRRQEQMVVEDPWLGLAAFPDGKRVLYTKTAQQEVDLMLVDGVR